MEKENDVNKDGGTGKEVNRNKQEKKNKTKKKRRKGVWQVLKEGAGAFKCTDQDGAFADVILVQQFSQLDDAATNFFRREHQTIKVIFIFWRINVLEDCNWGRRKFGAVWVEAEEASSETDSPKLKVSDGIADCRPAWQ